jgi:hypothetical protein
MTAREAIRWYISIDESRTTILLAFYPRYRQRQ